MKAKHFTWLAGIVITGLVACNNDSTTSETTKDSISTDSLNNAGATDKMSSSSTNAGYTDLNTGQKVEVWYDSTKKATVDKTTGNPVVLYVNMNNDTLYGYGDDAVIVNHAITMDKNGKWMLDEKKIIRKNGKIKLKMESSAMKADSTKK